MFCSHHAIFEIVFPLVGVPPPTKICFAEQIAIARILRAIFISASGTFSNAAGGFLKTHSLEASESGRYSISIEIFKISKIYQRGSQTDKGSIL
jgi:hypothetical protein